EGPPPPVGLGASDKTHWFPEHGPDETIGPVQRQLFVGLLKEKFMIRRSHQDHRRLRTEPEAKDRTAGDIPLVEQVCPVSIECPQMTQEGAPARQQRRQ